jgi:hypothetical protein
MPDDYRLVTCAMCQRKYECTPLDDHYETLLFAGGRVCESCLRGLAQARMRNADDQ